MGKDADQSLVQRLRQRGLIRQQAMEELYEGYHNRFYVFFKNAGMDAAIAEDLAHDTFIKAISGLMTYQQQSSFHSYLWTIARNTLIDEFRKRRRLTDIPDDIETMWIDAEWLPTASEPMSETTLAQFQLCVQAAFRRFRADCPDRARVIVMAVLGEFSMREIGRAIDRTEHAARQYSLQCRSRFREYLKDCLELLPK